MKTLDRQKLNVVNKTRSNIFGWRGQFPPGFKPLKFERFSNCGEFATIKRGQGRTAFTPSTSKELELATGVASQN